jgi:RNA polymerase sigma-70 factor, ECF subfamily
MQVLGIGDGIGFQLPASGYQLPEGLANSAGRRKLEAGSWKLVEWPGQMAPPNPAVTARSQEPRGAVTESPVPHLSGTAGDATGAGLAELARRAAGGERAAMETLLLEAQAVAWRFSRTVCGHAEDAEDAMQEALVQTFRFVSRLRDVEAFRPWLYRTVRNACLMSRRKRVGEPRHVLSLDALLPTPGSAGSHDAPERGKNPEELVENAALRRRLRKALGTLPPAFRAVVFLREMEGLSTRETSSVLAISEDTVKARLHRARLVLQRELEAGPGRASSRVASQARGRKEGKRDGGKNDVT